MMTIGSLLLAVGMGAWVVGALWANLTLVILGLVCSGLAMGLATPSYSTVIAAAVDPGDLGVASGMSTTMMNIGVIAGIQTMFTVLGDGRQPEDFARVFAVGAAAAALGLIGAGWCGRRRRRPRRSGGGRDRGQAGLSGADAGSDGGGPPSRRPESPVS